MQEESFGPVIGILPVAERRRSHPPHERFSPYGLTASIWTMDVRPARIRIGRTRSRPAPSS
jgi:acyl-CoA reductase-like NAD-dependent aldehyde dehydrogenase